MENPNTTAVVEAIDLTHDALGVCKLEDGYTVFVEDLLKGETAEIEVTQRKKQYGFGKVLQRLTKSPYRVIPKCKHFHECGGCGLMHMDYDLQLSFKKYRIESMLKNIKLENTPVRDMIGMVNPYYYRNKVEIKFHQGPKGIEAGFFQAKSHHVINLEECHITAKKSFEAVQLIKNLCNEFGIEAYDETTKTGILRSLLIRESLMTKELVILLHVAKKPFPHAEEIANRLIAKIRDISGIGYTLTKDESVLSTDPIEMIIGNPYLTEKINDVIYQVGFRSFFQTNTIQTEKLFQKAIEYANLTEKSKLIDAYCGIGSIGLNVAKKVYKVFGIEIVKSAISDARKNAEINQIQNAFFEVGDAETVIRKWGKFKFDVIFIDPPRRGCSQEFIHALLLMKIPKIVYISCDQATLGRDLKILQAEGYNVIEVTPVDMFPQTVQIESVTLLELKK